MDSIMMVVAIPEDESKNPKKLQTVANMKIPQLDTCNQLLGISTLSPGQLSQVPIYPKGVQFDPQLTAPLAQSLYARGQK